MKLVSHVKKLTKAKSLFKDRKISYCFTFFKATMSFGNRRGYSRALAR